MVDTNNEWGEAMSEVTEYFLRHYTLVLDNDQGSYNAVRDAVHDVLRGEEITLAEYTAMSTAERNDRFAAEIGERVLDLIGEWIEEAVPDSQASTGALLIHECMFMSGSSRELEWALGERYMPEDGDLDGVLDDDDTEDDE